MDIFNRPPSIAEDTLHYTVYPPPEYTDKASATTFAACIQELVEQLLPEYFIWHRDPFEVKLAANPDIQGQWMLEGRMRVGDSVDDEWCTVWLLREISARWDVAISVYDSDGEFLLIEAAEALPPWVQPSNTENRVWLYKSHLHLIPLAHASSPSKKRRRRKLPNAPDSDDEDDIATVEGIVWNRISGYPAAFRQHVHTTKAYLPADVARALSVRPELVQRAVEAFYTRDAIQLRYAHKMSRFPPQPSALMTVRMTRTAYAQLTGQKFFPPKVFGQWKEAEGSKELRQKDVGMKLLAVGFEILFQESKARLNSSKQKDNDGSSSMDARKDALRRTPDYIKYIQNLTSVGYFKGELEGSQLWKELETKAATVYMDARRDDDSNRQSFAEQVQAALDTAPANMSSNVDTFEDSDDWLNVNAESFDAMLEQRMGASTQRPKDPNAMDVDGKEGQSTQGRDAEDKLASDQASKLQDLASKVENFVEGEGDVEGARFEDEAFSDDDFADDNDDSSDEEMPPDPRSAAEKQAYMDTLVAPLEQADYGKMPASFYSASQRAAPDTDDTPEEVQTEGAANASKEQHKTPERAPRAPIIMRNKYEGVDSDDETDSDEDMQPDSEDEEDKPQVVGDVEIDMGEEEDEFLEFARNALGISGDQWEDIIRDRKARGAFVPSSEKSKGAPPKEHREEASRNVPEGHEPRQPEPGPRPNTNPNLDSFEAVMQAMDAELAKTRTAQGAKPPPSTEALAQKAEAMGKARADVAFKDKKETAGGVDARDKSKGKAKATESDDDEDDVEAAMDAELKALLESVEGEEGESMPTDYNLIKNFLESFKSQAGLSGPVSNLAGRLQPGWKLPRDEA
ncbi:SGT1 protein-domain-containing protein [Schizophyllum amplum]|uniref:SGT1 protein-domain-containing protein n=1 Tax=Schizophyllum amplum TaxID=97359 RepID=A0A550C5Q8_9AGAR|nr:SGT1 protein-domain-containing protein [Auriculariopsis ampla]